MQTLSSYIWPHLSLCLSPVLIKATLPPPKLLVIHQLLSAGLLTGDGAAKLLEVLFTRVPLQTKFGLQIANRFVFFKMLLLFKSLSHVASAPTAFFRVTFAGRAPITLTEFLTAADRTLRRRQEFWQRQIISLQQAGDAREPVSAVLAVPACSHSGS